MIVEIIYRSARARTVGISRARNIGETFSALSRSLIARRLSHIPFSSHSFVFRVDSPRVRRRSVFRASRNHRDIFPESPDISPTGLSKR